ncbi:hypothetical protein [Erwinia pyrifoliae]|uniref:Uncharacterized protein n=1 Tax=Erwinia pyrifoliae TaxID=79967 RepID=A0ABY5X5C4_ERWPY|nr:hypothetical protein [Erwinia pyrifoliae]MCT2388434.1 hypothetical protein [Erwinia pyrifoliae]MCU8586603.1 hypothetical protein [Erwinia pyrifoliae]UWS30493.1 hypothetical protein NYP81_03165 [Erwinia pyrifoliae]UWS32288.1 hypothetical protein NYP84_11550 [Erwinia pyrifoliae]UXK13501.1 hypothetical protein NYP80_06715 [Erwinia pyrifoliae]
MFSIAEQDMEARLMQKLFLFLKRLVWGIIGKSALHRKKRTYG